MAVFLGHVEQRGQHLPGQLDGDAAHPVEGLVPRQLIQDSCGPFPDQAGHSTEFRRREHRRDRLALLLVYRRVGHDEHGQVKHGIRRPFQGLAAEPDAAVVDIRRKQVVVGVHVLHVVIAGDRPEGAELAVGASVHRRLRAQPLEPGQHLVGPEQFRVRRVHLLKRNVPRVTVDIDGPGLLPFPGVLPERFGDFFPCFGHVLKESSTTKSAVLVSQSALVFDQWKKSLTSHSHSKTAPPTVWNLALQGMSR